MPKLLVVTPTTGKSRYLSDTIYSLNHISAAVPWTHTIACPAHSADKLHRAFPNTNIVVESSASMYGAINDGAAGDASWNWMTYINDDDFFLPGVAELTEDALRDTDPDVPTIVYSRAMLVKADGAPICEFPIVRNPARLLDFYRIRCNPLSTHGTFINRAAFEVLKGFDASFRYAGDMDLFVRALMQEVRFLHTPVLSVAFRLHGSNLTGDFERFALEEDRVRDKLQGGVPAWKAKLWRLGFVAGNWRSYMERYQNTGLWRVNDYLASLQEEDEVPQPPGLHATIGSQ